MGLGEEVVTLGLRLGVGGEELDFGLHGVWKKI